MKKAWAQKQTGFTIVELLIVVVVIAILAAITIVAYSGIQQKSRDSIRKSDLASVAKALQLRAVDKNDITLSSSGCGTSGTGEGWLSHRSSYGGATNYPRSILDCLIDDGYINKNIVDPSGCTADIPNGICNSTATAYLKLNCQSGGKSYSFLMARLESEVQVKPADLTAANCTYYNWYSVYKINYTVRVE